MRILIANRGEIARRVVRSAHRLGHQTVAAYSDPDATGPVVSEAGAAVRLGPDPRAYLDIEALIEAALRSGANAVHPGYGFLSENPDFARAVIDAGLVWIGPRPEAIETMGSKIEARRRAAAAGVPVIPGFDGSQDPGELAAAAVEIGFPVLIKAAAGGGGKGIRVVSEPSRFDEALTEAIVEAERSFGDGRMIVERYITRPRHIEVQVVGDAHGQVIQLGTRECSLQRRYQKVLEEAPAPELSAATRQALHEAAVALTRSIGYDSVGTVEMIVDDATGEHFFLEMNTRLQVEHPVTEEVTGLDLVELQIRVAGGGHLGLTQAEVEVEGHAIEARINAEDPGAGFAPQTGTITHLRVPEGVRWDAAIELGSEISPHYDPLVAKLIATGPDREAAMGRLANALDELLIGGLVTNTGLHRWLTDQAAVRAGRVTTRFLDEAELPAAPPAPVQLAADAWAASHRAGAAHGPWTGAGPLRLTPQPAATPVLVAESDGTVHELYPSSTSRLDSDRLHLDQHGVRRRIPASVDRATRSVALVVDGHTHTLEILERHRHWAPSAAQGHGPAGSITAPFTALVAEVRVAPGDQVEAGQVVVVVEAMKMLHSLTATGGGRVHEVRVSPGDQVASHQVLVSFTDHTVEL